MPVTVPEHAAKLIDMGFLPIPVEFKGKNAIGKAWPQLRITKESLPKYFNGRQLNIGVLLGDDHGSCDVDLDCAGAIAAGAVLLPETGMVYGHKSAPRSHYF